MSELNKLMKFPGFNSLLCYKSSNNSKQGLSTCYWVAFSVVFSFTRFVGGCGTTGCHCGNFFIFFDVFNLQWICDKNKCWQLLCKIWPCRALVRYKKVRVLFCDFCKATIFYPLFSSNTKFPTALAHMSIKSTINSTKVANQ